VFSFVAPQFNSVQWSLLPLLVGNPAVILHQKVKRAARVRKREMIKGDHDYQKRVIIQMKEGQDVFEQVQQPQVERQSSRMTPYHRIDETTKRNYLRAYARARLHPLIVARESGLPLLQSQSTTAVEHQRKHCGGTQAQINPSGVYGKRMYYEKSTIQGWGLFALEQISSESLICEYSGEVVRSRVADKREKNISEWVSRICTCSGSTQSGLWTRR
jgi:hypothetical protein